MLKTAILLLLESKLKKRDTFPFRKASLMCKARREKSLHSNTQDNSKELCDKLK